jgi:hypothetical protein
VPQQYFDFEPGIGWFFAPLNTSVQGESNGITGPNTAFNPPSFNSLPFTKAAILQGPGSLIDQHISGFVQGRYLLSFYLGSRYASGCCDGNQTVVAKIDGRVINVWKLGSFSPFSLVTAAFEVGSSGTHILTFEGIETGDHTAFLSGVSVVQSE